MKKVNIRESLLEIDRATDCLYDLTSLYEACKLDDEDKKKMVQYIEAHEDPAEMGKFLATKCQGVTESVESDDDVIDMKAFLASLDGGEQHSIYALEEKEKELNEDTGWRTNPSNRKEALKYLYSKISPFDRLTDDDSRYWEVDQSVTEGDECVVVKEAPKGAAYKFSFLPEVDIDIYFDRMNDTWYVVDKEFGLEEAVPAALMALGTAAATGFGQSIGDKVGSKLFGEDADLEYENDAWNDGEVAQGNTFFSDGYDWKWVKRISDVHHLDFDNWAAWMAFRPEDENNPSGPNVVQFFIVDEDTGFIDWGPVDTAEEAIEFLDSKVKDWEMDECAIVNGGESLDEERSENGDQEPFTEAEVTKLLKLAKKDSSSKLIIKNGALRKTSYENDFREYMTIADLTKAVNADTTLTREQLYEDPLIIFDYIDGECVGMHHSFEGVDYQEGTRKLDLKYFGELQGRKLLPVTWMKYGVVFKRKDKPNWTYRVTSDKEITNDSQSVWCVRTTPASKKNPWVNEESRYQVKLFNDLYRKGLIEIVSENAESEAREAISEEWSEKDVEFNDRYFPRVDINDRSRYDYVQYRGKDFAYDKKHNIVIYLFQDEEELEHMGAEAPWRELDAAGLSLASWNDKEERAQYLDDYASDIDDESSYLVQDFIDNELPYYREQGLVEDASETMIATNSKGDYLVAASSGKGFTAFNKDGVCLGGIDTDDESEAKNKFMSGKLDEATATLDKPTKKDLTSIEGTIASVLNAHKAEIEACGMNMNAIKSCVTKILTSGEVKGDAAAQKAVMIINNCRGLNQLLSTLAGYMTGVNAITNSKTSRRNKDVSASMTTEAVEDDSAETPYTHTQVFNELKLETRNFSIDGDTIQYYYKEEADRAVKILNRHYESVEMTETANNWFQIEFKDKKRGGKKVAENAEGTNEALQEEWNREWDNIGIEIEKAARAQHIGVDFINTDRSVMGAFTATFEINRGDWKHDHWAFDEVVKEYLANNEKYALWKIDTNQIGSSDDDSYSAEHIAFIVPKDKMELLNSMRGLFAESVNPAELVNFKGRIKHTNEGFNALLEVDGLRDMKQTVINTLQGIEGITPTEGPVDKLSVRRNGNGLVARAGYRFGSIMGIKDPVEIANMQALLDKGFSKHDLIGGYETAELLEEFFDDNIKVPLQQAYPEQVVNVTYSWYGMFGLGFGVTVRVRITDKDKLENSDAISEGVNPADLTDCPECGDTSFDSKRGKCTKCDYREELDESKAIKESFPRNIDLDQVVIQVANLVDDKALGDDWIEVFPTRDASQSAGGEYFIPLEITGPEDITKKATFRTRNGRIEVAFLNGSEAMCDSAESIARFIAGEFGLGLGGETPLLNYMPEEELQEGRMTDRYRAQVKQNFDAEIDSTDISHEIAEDGLSFTIVRADGTKLEFNAAEGYTTTKPANEAFEDDFSDEELANILGGDLGYDNNPDGIETPEETEARLAKEASIHESASDCIYLFPELTDEDIRTLKAYNLQFLGKNHGPDGSEDNWVVRGTKSSLYAYAERYLGYELHPDYLYDADDFAGDIE